jgi:hypothetical protein
MVLGEDFSKYISFPSQSLLHQMPRFFHLSSRNGTVAHLQHKYHEILFILSLELDN